MRNTRHVTPEEKLLHIIEKSDGGSKSDGKKRPGARRFLNLVSVFKNLYTHKLSLRGINKALMWVSVVATLILVFYFVNEEKALQKNLKNTTTAIDENDSQYALDIKSELPGLSTYMGYVENNNPFHVLPIVQKPLKVEEPAFALTLVGIFWSDKPQAVIEDGNTQKNYFVYAGDTIGKYKVTAITQNEVKLVSEDGEKTLK